MVPARRLNLTAGTFALAAAACLVVALLRRHSLHDAGFQIEGAYFNRSVGAPAYAGVFSYSGTVLDPFHPLNAYLWLGGATAFIVAAVVLAIVGRPGTR